MATAVSTTWGRINRQRRWISASTDRFGTLDIPLISNRNTAVNSQCSEQLITEHRPVASSWSVQYKTGSTESGWPLTAVSSHTAAGAKDVVTVFSFGPLARRLDRKKKKKKKRIWKWYKSLNNWLRTTRFNIQKFYTALALRWLFCTNLRRDSDFCFIRH